MMWAVVQSYNPCRDITSVAMPLSSYSTAQGEGGEEVKQAGQLQVHLLVFPGGDLLQEVCNALALRACKA